MLCDWPFFCFFSGKLLEGMIEVSTESGSDRVIHTQPPLIGTRSLPLSVLTA
jgi:hypothetical protein